MTEENPATKKVEKNEISKNEKMLAAVGYFSFFCVLPIILKRDSKFCQFHGKQALVLTIIALLFSWTSWGGGGILEILIKIIYVAAGATGAANAFSGKIFSFPFISEMAKKIQF